MSTKYSGSTNLASGEIDQLTVILLRMGKSWAFKKLLDVLFLLSILLLLNINSVPLGHITQVY